MIARETKPNFVGQDYLTKPDNGFITRPARSSTEKDRVYRLRYQAYRSVDAIPAAASQRFRDAYDLRPNSQSYLLTDGCQDLGSIRATVWIPRSSEAVPPYHSRGLMSMNLPCMETYGDVIEDQIGLDKTIVESSRFVSAECSFDVLLGMQFELFRMIVANAHTHEADWVVTAVRRKHAALYRRLFGMRRLSEPRLYYGLNAEMLLVGCDVQSQLPLVSERHPQLRMSLHEALQLSV